MKTISIHNLEDKVAALLRKKAKESNMSLNKTVQKLLKRSLGLEKTNTSDHRGEFRDLSGVWSKNDEDEFKRTTREFETIHKEEWS